MSGRERILLILTVAAVAAWFVLANLENISLPGACPNGIPISRFTKDAALRLA